LATDLGHQFDSPGTAAAANAEKLAQQLSLRSKECFAGVMFGGDGGWLLPLESPKPLRVSCVAPTIFKFELSLATYL
jgi:hypothetical protein